ncbi:hypothetical protein D9M68_836230 [compost metagenome]
MWIITKDHLEPLPAGDLFLVAVVPPGFTMDMQPALMPYAFRLYDDDDNLCYEGWSSDRESELAFQPLDWAMADAGCTRIDYRQDNGTWETL